jgi:UDP-N-acetylmuramoyl-tripeptide--D-alanyl-D-alanine ligase
MDPIAPEEFVSALKGHPQGPIPSPSITGVSTDSRAIRPGDAFFALVGDRFDGHDYIEQVVAAGASVIVASKREAAAAAQAKGWPLVLVENTVAALGRLAAWYRTTLPARLVAVTGSNGKTTTKTMLEGVLSKVGKVISAPKSFNNNIGVPLTLLSADHSHNTIVLEMGTNHPGEIAELAALARPDLAVITSIGTAHIEGLGGLEGVAREKTSLLDYVPATGFAAVCIDEPIVVPYLRSVKCKVLRFGTSRDAELRAEGVEADDATLRFKVNGRWPVTMHMSGRHNATNALGAWAIGSRLGMTPEQIAGALAEVQPPDMRLQRFQYGPVTIINDAYNANPASMAAGLRTLADMPVPAGGRRVTVLADMLELGEQSQSFHEQTGRALAALGCIDCLIAVGPNAQHLADSAADVQNRDATGKTALAVHRFTDADQAAKGIAKLLQPNDIALLKGSRGMHLEKLLPAILQAFGQARPGQSVPVAR